MKSQYLKTFPKAGLQVKGWTVQSKRNGDFDKAKNWPKISVITPSYNQAGFIEETIRSVLLQNYPNLEYIVIDGASTDGSTEIIKKYDAWINYWVSEKDEGQTQAINKGIKKATGEWLIYLNSDDIFYPGTLLKVGRHILLNPDVLWVAGHTQVFDEKVIYNVKKPDTEGIDKPENWITYRVHVPQHSSFVNRKVYDELGEYDESLQYVFDLEFGLRMGLHGYVPNIIDAILAGFRMHNLSKTKTSRMPFLKEQKQLIDMYSDSIPDENVRWAHEMLNKRMASNTIYDSLDGHSLSRKRILKALKKACKLNPAVIKERYFWGALKKTLF